MAKKRRVPAERLDSLVLDASITVSWYFRDEADEYADAVARRVPTAKPIVPSVWPLEVANTMLVGERRKRDSVTTLLQWSAYLASLPIAVDEQNVGRVFGDVLAIARDHDLSVYDASYVELAIRTACRSRRLTPSSAPPRLPSACRFTSLNRPSVVLPQHPA